MLPFIKNLLSVHIILSEPGIHTEKSLFVSVLVFNSVFVKYAIKALLLTA